jgi:hypothetical protein
MGIIMNVFLALLHDADAGEVALMVSWTTLHLRRKMLSTTPKANMIGVNSPCTAGHPTHAIE